METKSSSKIETASVGNNQLPGRVDADKGHGGGKSSKPSVAELAEWANEQRRAYREGRLAQRKIRLLNLAGFNWVEDATLEESLVRKDNNKAGYWDQPNL